MITSNISSIDCFTTVTPNVNFTFSFPSKYIVITVYPSETAVTTPFSSTLAIASLFDLYFSVPLAYFKLALILVVSPILTIDAFSNVASINGST